MSLIKKLFYIVEGFELHIPEWSLSDSGITALCGPSGGGKTTIIKILSGLLPSKNLEWHFKGKDLATLSPPERKLGVLFQDLHLFPHLSAQKNILFAAKARKLSFKDVQSEFESLISSLELKEKLSLFPEQLSGGEKQRVALARALISRPQFVFLDEPFSHLDEKTRRRARLLTAEVLKKKNIPTLLVSHNVEDVKELADEVVFLKKGRLSKSNE
ncbi:MAG: ATP-binding cassette domain-containing protein [Bdellovibrionales bacterium]|nr:ATP-binding cassette domain-containing protein [Bdellovibrionales bacterium]